MSEKPMSGDKQYTQDPAFDAWRDSLPKTHWARFDLSACRLGWDAGRRHEQIVSGSPFTAERAGTIDRSRAISIFCEIANRRLHEAEAFNLTENMRATIAEFAERCAQSAGGGRTISGVKLVKMFKDQRDEVADVLRRLMAKLREESGSTDPMEPFAYDASWEAMAKEADAILAKCPSYTQQVENLCEGLGITREELEAGLRSHAAHSTQEAQ